VARVADLAPELAVAEGAGAAFAELHVRLGVQHFLAPQAPGVLGALAHGLAALQHDGRKPICASTSAANMPQGPKPITTGRRRRRGAIQPVRLKGGV
jgi:hypothetical protein